MSEHTHVTDINAANSCYAYTCGVAEHTHTAECLDCEIEEHAHSVSCCTKTEHIHNESCCSLDPHSHSINCCGLTAHTHTANCYTGVKEKVDEWMQDYINNGTRAEGLVYEGRFNQYICINNTWYVYDGSVSSGQIAPHTCGSIAHTHGTGCNAEKCTVGYEHTHNTGSCNGQNCSVGHAHTHGDGTCVCKDSKTEHTHTEDCYDCTYAVSYTHLTLPTMAVV